MTKLVKNLIIGGSATTVLAGGGTGVALALSGKKSSHSNNLVVVRTANVNTKPTQVQQEFINTISGTPETYTGFSTSYSWKETKDLDKELAASERQNLEIQNFIKTFSGTPETYTGFHRANIRDAVKKLDNNLMVSQQNAEINGRTSVATQMQTPALPIEQHSLVSPELATILKENADKLIAEADAKRHELAQREKADRKAEDKAVAEALQHKAELEARTYLATQMQTPALPTEPHSLVSPELATIMQENMNKLVAEADAMRHELVMKQKADKKAEDKELAQLEIEKQKIMLNIVGQATHEALMAIVNHNIEEAIKLGGKSNSGSIYMTAQAIYAEQQRQIDIQNKVEQIQNIIHSQMSSLFNGPVVMTKAEFGRMIRVDSSTQTARFGNDLTSTFGPEASGKLNNILKSLQVEGVEFGLKVFGQNDKLNILVVAVDKTNGHELVTSSQTPILVDHKEPTKPVTSASSTAEMAQAIAVAYQSVVGHANLFDMVVGVMEKIAKGQPLEIPLEPIDANGILRQATIDFKPSDTPMAVIAGWNGMRWNDSKNIEANFQAILNAAKAKVDKETTGAQQTVLVNTLNKLLAAPVR